MADSMPVGGRQASRDDLIRGHAKKVIRGLGGVFSGDDEAISRKVMGLLRDAGDDAPAVLRQSRTTMQRRSRLVLYSALTLTLVWVALLVAASLMGRDFDDVFWGYTALAFLPWGWVWFLVWDRRSALRHLTAIEKTTEGLALVGGGLLERAQVVQRLAGLSPREFEEELAQLFEKLGYSVKRGSFVDDYGADVIATKGGETLVVQAKKTASSIGRPTLQKLQGAAIHFRGKPVLVTTGSFTGPARWYAVEHGIELIDGDTLIEKLVAAFSKRR